MSEPRLVIAATRSADGKTTVATGLMAALRARGLAVSAHKVGPDYIDPGYHAVAAGRPGRNLDPFLAGEELIAPLFLHGARGADVAVIEGVMGLFDGAAGRGDFASTAHVARLLGAPVVLVVSAAGAGRSIAATVRGFATFDPAVQLAGVVLNQVSTQRHEQILREALAPVPVLGALPAQATLHTPSRHLGLVPAAERSDQVGDWLPRLRELIARHLDLDGLLAIARSAGPLAGRAWSPDDAVAAAATAEAMGAATSAGPSAAAAAPGPDAGRAWLADNAASAATSADPPAAALEPGPPDAGRPVRIAVAAGRAFTFGYAEHRELLEAAGAQVAEFDPMTDERLPDGSDALIAGGGFPEVYAEALAANAGLRDQVRRRAAAGMPVVAECAGLLWLGAALDGREQCAVLPGAARMTGRLTLGYREAVALRDSPLAPAGTAIRAHEFHRTASDPAGDTAWRLGDGSRQGWASGRLLASYLHLHWAALPGAAPRLAAAARAARQGLREQEAPA